jgi:RNA:NAD 2'-phosphotransferase (TPT1/KptA family)
MLPLRRGVQQLFDGHTGRLLASHLDNDMRGYGSSPEQRRKMNQSKRNTAQHTAEIRISKILSFLLRHGAKREHIPMREDGYVAVKDIVSTPVVFCV